MQETSRARKRKNQNRASDITHPQSSRPSLDQHDDLIEPSHDNEMEECLLKLNHQMEKILQTIGFIR
ncbi:hypothetical protein ACE6H2_022729 [Prunus campanulata]